MYPYKSVISLPKNKRLILQPFGDIQSENLLDHLDEIVADRVADKGRGDLVRMFGTGDYFETHSPSERAKIAGANLHETSLQAMGEYAVSQADDFIERVSPLKKDIITIQQGHHWKDIKLKSGVSMSTDLYIAQKLGAEYAGDGIARLDFLINGLPFKILVMHGYGSARTARARLNKRIEMRSVNPTCNWYLQAHDNSMVMDPRQVLVGDTYIKQYYGGVGCIQASYEIGTEAGYAEKLALPPACIGFVRMQIWIGEKRGKPVLRYEGIS